MMTILIITIILLIPQSSSYQHAVTSDDWIELLIEYLPDELDDVELDEIVASLENYAQNPIHIEFLTKEHLIDFKILDEFEISSVLNWKQSTPQPDQTVLSLQNQIVLEPVVLNLLDVFIQFYYESPRSLSSEKFTFSKLKSQFKGTFDIKISGLHPKPMGYESPSYYLGNSQSLKEHVSLKIGQSRMSLARNKVAGEAHNYPLTNGLSSYSAYLNSNDLPSFGLKSNFIGGIYLGDYKIRFGLGSIAASGTMRIDSRSMRTINTGVSSINQNGSSTTGKFFRGMGISTKVKDFQISIFGSSRHLTASTKDSIYYLPGWYNHARTQNEVQKQHNVSIKSLGTIFKMNKTIYGHSISIGWIGLYHLFDKRISLRDGLSYVHDFRGKNGFETSISGSIKNSKTLYSFEVAKVKNGYGFVHSIQWNWDYLNSGLWSRHYSTGFKPLLGNAPSAFSGNGNEKGFGFWIRLKPNSHFTIESWGDRFQSLDIRFGTIAPISGQEIGFKGMTRLNRDTRIEVTLKSKNRLTNQISLDSFDREINQRLNHISNALKFQIRTMMAKNILTILRLELNRQLIEHQKTHGIGLSHLVRINVKTHFIYLQHTIFNASDHQSRVYFYEYDMINSLSMPSFSGFGHRSYLMLHVEMWRKLILRLKLARVFYSDRVIIGTNHDSTSDQQRFNFAAQLRVRF